MTFLNLHFNNVFLKGGLGQLSGGSPGLCPSTTTHLGKGWGEGHSTEPQTFQFLRAVGTDNPRLMRGWSQENEGTQDLG